MEVALAIDSDEDAIRVYSNNFPSSTTMCRDISQILDSPVGMPASWSERKLARLLGQIEIVVGGPPCQGHSNLNNHSRRNDPKNRLYDRVARFAELVKPKHLIIENVQDVLHDRGDVVQTTRSSLQRLGYSVAEAVIDVSLIGVPQRRRRHALVASLERQPDLNMLIKDHARDARDVEWAISDLVRLRLNSAFDQAAVPTLRNRRRIDFLFRNRLHNLPDRLRPDCHRFKDHSYKSVYGRMYWDRPAQTITSGFRCMGQGRFVHPKVRRTLTAHEAARLQFIPDFFSFEPVLAPTALTKMIANAVPPKLSYVLALELLR